ncbi:Ran-binding protein 17 [Camellia lanceoleosa]|uniref:Ran-binding protein 17 n=1 Tax=Camellia lanceoleosa TaxID=1840588 RepID=A0ACC0HB96_9ERIC|nr:Ran-binding protein 17 [Camellia lanceoleosa]
MCASAVHNLATYYFKHITVGESPTTPAALNLARHVAGCPGVFLEILKTLFEIVLFEDCGNQWSLSRPMLSLILISEEVIVETANFEFRSCFVVFLFRSSFVWQVQTKQ